MGTPKGGRGKKADYKTVPVRCPEPLKFTVHELIRRYHAQEFIPPPAQRSLAELSKSEILASMAELAAELSDEERQRVIFFLRQFLETNKCQAEIEG